MSLAGKLSRSAPASILGAVLILLSASCEQSPEMVAPESSAQISASIAESNVIPISSIDVYWVQQAALSDQELIDSLAAVGGRALVALKAVGSHRLGEVVNQGVGSRGQAVSYAHKPGADAQSLRAGLQFLATRNLTITRYLENMGMVQVIMDPSEAPMIRNNPLIDYVAPRGFDHLDSEMIDWGIDTIRAQQAWTTSNGSGAKVLMIDEGYDRGREDLPVVPLGNCDGPWGGGCSPDTPSHGTTTIGALTMRAGNGVGGVGVAPGISASDLYVYSACHDHVCATDDVVDGIDQGITWGVDVINMSFSGGYHASEAEAVARADSADIVLIASAGNTNNEQYLYPAGLPAVLGVSGISSNGEFAFNSNTPCMGGSTWGNHVSLSAPFDVYTTTGASGYNRRCGTSYSAPAVAGAAAAVRAANSALSAAEVRSILTSTAVDHGDEGWDKYFGYGVLAVEAAVEEGLPPQVSITGPTRIRPGATCTWHAVVSQGSSNIHYDWSGDIDPYTGDEEYYTGKKDSGQQGDTFTIRVDVSTIGGSDSHVITVREDANAMVCFQ